MTSSPDFTVPPPPEPDERLDRPGDDALSPVAVDDLGTDHALAELGRLTRWLAGVDHAGLGDGALLRLVGHLAAVTDLTTATQVAALGHVQDRGATIARDGLLPDAWLALTCRRSSLDRRTLTVAAEVLPSLPHLRAAFAAGIVSWSEVRVVCLKTVTLSTQDRRHVDQTLAGDPDRLARMGADQLLDLLYQTLDALHPVELERQERREFESQYVAFRPRLDGTGEIHGDLDAPTFADIAGRVADAADQLPSPPDHEDKPRWWTKGWRQALALHGLVTQRPAGRDDSARLLVTVEGATLADTGLRRLNLDLDESATAARDGHDDDFGEQRAPASGAASCAPVPVLTVGAPAGLRATMHTRSGRRPVSAKLLSRLIPSAELRLLLTGDGIPLKAGRRRRYATRAQRDAALAFHGGCGWPRCPAPWWMTDMHHVVDFNGPTQGSTDADNLVPSCPVHHRALTYGQWTMRLLPDRSVEVRRGHHRYRSWPRGQPPRAGPDPPSHDAGNPRHDLSPPPERSAEPVAV